MNSKGMFLDVGEMAKFANDTPGFHDLVDELRGMFDMNPFRYQKTWSFYKLASNAEGGIIVELGSYHGCGTIALCKGSELGNGMPVFTFDAYKEWRGWAGEPYKETDFDVFRRNVKNAGVFPSLTVMEFSEAAKWMISPISLLIWDGGVTKVEEDVAPWIKFIVPGGLLAFRDTLTFSLKCDEYAQKLIDGGEFIQLPNMPGGMIILKSNLKIEEGTIRSKIPWHERSRLV